MKATEKIRLFSEEKRQKSEIRVKILRKKNHRFEAKVKICQNFEITILFNDF